MASPRRNDPNFNRSTLENLPEVERQVGTGRPFSWAWLWIPVAIAAFWFVGWGWGPYGGWWWGHGAESATQSANATAPAPPANGAQPASGALAGGTNPASHGSSAAAQEPAPAAPPAAVSGTGVAVLDAPNKGSFAGQSFQIQNVPVQKQASARAVWIGTNNARNAGPTLLVLPQGAKEVQQGDRLNATGKVVKAPSAARAEQEWSLSSADAHRLEQEGAYVQATAVQGRG